MVAWNWEGSTAVSWAKRIVQRGGALEGAASRVERRPTLSKNEINT